MGSYLHLMRLGHFIFYPKKLGGPGIIAQKFESGSHKNSLHKKKTTTRKHIREV